MPRTRIAPLLVALVACSQVDRSGRSLSARQPGRLSRQVEPRAYRLHLKVDPRQPGFSGTSEIRVRVRRPVRQIRFHAQGIRFKSARLVTRGGRLHALRLRQEHPFVGVEEWSALVDRTLTPGDYTLRFAYEGTFNRRLYGLYRVKHRGRWFAYTHFETAYARQAFPCMDEPRWMAPFDLSLTVPIDMQAFANTPTVAELRRGRYKEVRFAVSRPLPTYLVGFVVGDLERVAGPQSTTKLGGVVVRGKTPLVGPALQMTAELLPLLEDYFGIPYPYRKLDLVGVVDFPFGAMENAGLIAFREDRLFISPMTSPADERSVALTIGHELAHQWFGNLVTMAWWNDLWLSEAFATWMGGKVVDRWRPAYNMRFELQRWRNAGFAQDALASAQPVRRTVRTIEDAEAAFDMLTYGKGGAVLTMLEHWVGAERFRAGVRHYLRRHKWRAATAADLFASWDKLARQPVSAVARSFLDRAGVPFVQVHSRCTAKGVELMLAQVRYRPLGAHYDAGYLDGRPWMIPVCLKIGREKGTSRECFLLSKRTTTVVLSTAGECPGWIHPNAEERGYYRWGVSEGALRALTTAQTKLAATSQMALLEQAWAAVKAGELNPRAYLDALVALKNSRQSPVIMQLIAGIWHLAHVWTGQQSALQRLARLLLEPAAQSLGWQAAEGESAEVTRLRPILLETLGRYGNSAWVRQDAAALARRYLQKPTAVDQDIAAAALSLAAAIGELTLEQALGLLGRAADPIERGHALIAMAALPAGAPIAAVLRLLLRDALTDEESWQVLDAIAAREETRRQAFIFVQEHYDALIHRSEGVSLRSASRFPLLLRHFCRGESLDAARTFFQGKGTIAAGPFLAQAQEQAEQCLALRRWGEHAVLDWLEREL